MPRAPGNACSCDYGACPTGIERPTIGRRTMSNMNNDTSQRTKENLKISWNIRKDDCNMFVPVSCFKTAPLYMLYSFWTLLLSAEHKKMRTPYPYGLWKAVRKKKLLSNKVSISLLWILPQAQEQYNRLADGAQRNDFEVVSVHTVNGRNPAPLTCIMYKAL